MYQIYADNTLIYDSTLEDYKITKGLITLEADKSGSFVFGLYPDHPFYDCFVRLKTVVTVYKAGRIVFRGRVLNDTRDYWNHKELTCEGELGFFQDSIVRPYSFSGSPSEFFAQLVAQHNAQVDEEKQFKIGTVDAEIDGNDYIARSNEGYETTLANLNSRLLEDATGGHFYITHGDDWTDPRPTLNYVADFKRTATQTIEFGENLRDYTEKVDATETATAIIPVGMGKITIAGINNGVDYVYSPEGVAAHGWIFKMVEWEDVADPTNLKKKAEAYLDSLTGQTLTLDLTALDKHLLGDSAESIRVCDYVRVISAPHQLDKTMLCTKQTMDLLNPANDTVTLGYVGLTFTASSKKAVDKVYKAVESANKGVEECKAAIEVTNGTIGLYVQKGEVVSAINLSPENIQIQANRISLEGSITANGTFEIDEEGYLRCTGGTLGDFTVGADGGLFSNGTLKVGQMTMAEDKILGFKLGRDNLHTYADASGDLYILCMSTSGHIFPMDVSIKCLDVGAAEMNGYTSNRYQFWADPPGLPGTSKKTVVQVITDGLNVRNMAGTGGSLAGQLNSGELVAYNGSVVTIDVDGVAWAQINEKYVLTNNAGSYSAVSLGGTYYIAQKPSSGSSKTYWQTTVIPVVPWATAQ